MPRFDHACKGDRLGIDVRHAFATPPVDTPSGRAGRATFVPPDVAPVLSTTNDRLEAASASG